MRFNLASMPAAPYAREGRNNMPHRRTVAEMRRALPAGARGFAMFRTGSGRASNGFCHFTMPDGSRVARYHETDILTVAPNGDVRITFGGWHTISTRGRFDAAAKLFGVPLRAGVVGKTDVTEFRTSYDAAARWRLDDHGWAERCDGSDFATLTIPGRALGLVEIEFSDGRETYRVSPFGHISRECMGWRYSGSWTLRGIVMRDNFGNVRDRIMFPELRTFIAGRPILTHKNGKPFWFVMDMDHGTPREWGNGITRLVALG